MTARDENISQGDFTRLRNLIYDRTGINLGPDKKTMLELRVKRRLSDLALPTYSEYCDYLFSHQGQKEELVHLIDVVTTNKTDFFREPGHFDFLVQKVLPDFMVQHAALRPFLIWSAGCSSGEEPYTITIVLNEFALAHPGFRFRVLATDISTKILAKAQLAVFSIDAVRPVPAALQKKYFMRRRDRDSKVVRLVPELRRFVEFRRLNFKDADFQVSEKADVIFCRNVLIYFDRRTQEQILQKLAAHLLPGGYLCVGHAEALHDMHLPLSAVGTATYRKVHASS